LNVKQILNTIQTEAIPSIKGDNPNIK
jgi:hypothetical protein